MSGRGNLVVKVTDLLLECHEFEPSTTEDPPCRGNRYTLNMSRLKRPPVGVVWYSYANPTSLAHADASRDVLRQGGSQTKVLKNSEI
ncbi:hypothetical protein TNCV_571191 [Trichonephila clavipes]|nr:hypothetical protein TNCV_571191 [Trichonephila clavipes]